MDDVLFEYDIRPNSEISRYDPVEWMGFHLEIDEDGYLIYRKYTFESLTGFGDKSRDDYITQISSGNLDKLKRYIVIAKQKLLCIPRYIQNNSYDGDYYVLRLEEKIIEGANILGSGEEDILEQLLEEVFGGISEILLEEGIVLTQTKMIFDEM